MLTLNHRQCHILGVLSRGPCDRSEFQSDDGRALRSLEQMKPPLVKPCSDSGVRLSWIGQQAIFCAAITYGNC